MKIRPLGSEFFHADGQTERLMDRWRNRRTDGESDGTWRSS